MMEKFLSREDSKSEDSEIIRQLKEKFQSTSERSIQVQMLMILPQSWSIRKIEVEFAESVGRISWLRLQTIIWEKGAHSETTYFE